MIQGGFSIVHKLRTYITFPAFSIASTWRGSSEIVAKFNFSLDAATSILGLFAPLNANYCACISWKPTDETIVRYKLWEDVGEILYVPLYEGQQVGEEFAIEIWNTPESPTIGGAYSIPTSTLTLPTDFCDDDDRELSLATTQCNDLTFELAPFIPLDGDYYIKILNCGLTELIKNTAVADANGSLIRATDGSWFYLQVLRFDGIRYVSLVEAPIPPEGTREYLPLLDLNSGEAFEIRAQRFENGDGTYGYSPYIGGFAPADGAADAVGAVYTLASDGLYYGIRLRVNWDYAVVEIRDAFSGLEVDQTNTVL